MAEDPVYLALPRDVARRVSERTWVGGDLKLIGAAIEAGLETDSEGQLERVAEAIHQTDLINAHPLSPHLFELCDQPRWLQEHRRAQARAALASLTNPGDGAA